jgi:hypothetical protein
MGCLPESGGCERRQTDPFVDHLNEIEKTNYDHVACLDRIHRNSPQPEALYIDAAAGTQLVIERKNIVWPPDYARRHKQDHILAERLIGGLKNLTANGPYAIELEQSDFNSPEELAEFADVIIQGVHELFTAVERGEAIGSLVGPPWRFFREHPGERAFDWDAPDSGLRITWNLPDSLMSSAQISPDLINTVSRLFSSCVDKFHGYLEARRILMIEPHGEIRYNPDSWWADLFAVVKPAADISEIWSGSYDWLDDTQRGWMFDKLYPVVRQSPFKLELHEPSH